MTWQLLGRNIFGFQLTSKYRIAYDLDVGLNLNRLQRRMQIIQGAGPRAERAVAAAPGSWGRGRVRRPARLRAGESRIARCAACLLRPPHPPRLTGRVSRSRRSVARCGHFTPDRVWVEDANSGVVEERATPRASFAGHVLTTPWNKLHEVYFVTYALWNHLATPFVFTEPGLKSVSR